MNLLLALSIAALFAGGIFLMLKHDVVRTVVGIILVSNAANLFIMSSRLSGGMAPIHPIPAGAAVADPVVQALTLTAIVITFGVAVILLGLVYRVYTSHGTVDLDDLAAAEVADQQTLQAGAGGR